MYVENSTRRVMTYRRDRVHKVTASLPRSHHILEDVLANSTVRKALLWMTRPGADGKTFFEKLCQNYENPQADLWTRLKWGFPSWIISLGLQRANLNKETMKQHLFHHPPTVRALTLTAKSIGTYGLTVPQRYTAPLFVVWNYTQACNLSCRHCYQEARHKPLPNELTTDEKIDLIDQMAEEFVPFLAFAGGEPLVAKDLWRILEQCQKRGIHVTLATNGTMLTPETCARLREAGVKYIEVSLDSIRPEEHDSFRGMKGAWERTVQGIKNSVASGVRTGMACCFTRETVDTVDEMVKFAIDLGCKTFAHFNFIPVGRGREIMEQDLTPGQREFLLRKLQRVLEEGVIGVVSTAPQFGRSCIVYGPEEGVFATGHAGRGEGKKTMVLSRYIGGCGAGRCYCSVQPHGTITPCVYIRSVEVGDIRQKSFREIWNNPLFDVLADREDRSDHCGVCDYKFYCGGCRARALAYTNDIQAGDPGCIYNHHQWQELIDGLERREAVVSMAQSAGGDGDALRSTLVQIAGALTAVRPAVQAGELQQLSSDEVREVERAAQRLSSDPARPG